MLDMTRLDGDYAYAYAYAYVIVGAGTAGCVLAARLAEDPKTCVLLLEAGGSDRYHWVQIPVGYLYCIGNPRTGWMMRTASEPGLSGRSLAYPRGKVLGGCTSVNGMIYMRGQAADYDGWRDLGKPGWGWSDVLPYFRKSEDYHGPSGDMHAKGGPWKVSRQRLKWDILEAVQQGARKVGIEPRADFKVQNTVTLNQLANSWRPNMPFPLWPHVEGTQPVRHVHAVQSGRRPAQHRISHPAAVHRQARRSAPSVSGNHRLCLSVAPDQRQHIPHHLDRSGPAARDPSELPLDRPHAAPTLERIP